MADKWEALREALVNVGTDEETADTMVSKMQEYQQAGVSGKLGDDGHGEYQEKEPIEISLGERGRPDLVRLLAGTTSADGLERMIITSEIPSDMLMDVVLALTIDQITKPEYGGSVIETLLMNFMLAMKARERKLVKDVIHIYAVGEEMKKEAQGPPGLLA